MKDNKLVRTLLSLLFLIYSLFFVLWTALLVFIQSGLTKPSQLSYMRMFHVPILIFLLYLALNFFLFGFFLRKQNKSVIVCAISSMFLNLYLIWYFKYSITELTYALVFAIIPTIGFLCSVRNFPSYKKSYRLFNVLYSAVTVFILLITVLVIPYKSGSYYKNIFKVYTDSICGDSADNPCLIEVKDADPLTFRELDNYFAKDRSNVYILWCDGSCYAEKIEEIDSKSLVVLGEGFVKDKNNIFWYDQIVEVDYVTFEYLGSGYYFDKDFLYYKRIKVIDIFEINKLSMRIEESSFYGWFYDDKIAIYKGVITNLDPNKIEEIKYSRIKYDGKEYEINIKDNEVILVEL